MIKFYYPINVIRMVDIFYIWSMSEKKYIYFTGLFH